MPTDGRQAFVYWRVEPAALPDAVAALRALHARWAAEWPALQARLFVRADPDAPPTLMETYALDHPDGLSDAELRRIHREADAATVAWRIGSRHEELFSRCL